MSTLVIVESPAKARTIEKFLGKDFTVRASMGHVRDLPKSGFGVDIDAGFVPEYAVTDDKKKTVNELKKLAKGADRIILATDEDREGEAIAWHLVSALGLTNTDKGLERIVFHEITKGAILKALENPRDIDTSLVDAQQARRVLDRLVGYELSPLLWKKVRYGLSAGRVQSVAVRLVVEREREIRAFNPEEYWSITADLKTPRGAAFAAELSKIDGKKAVVPNGEDAGQIEEAARAGSWQVATVERKEQKRNPPPPFTTSTLQQEASRKLGFSVKKTMTLAQRLYEGRDTGEGLITYMRTDSVNLASSAVAKARSVIEQKWGKDYVPEAPRGYKSKAKGAQEAHEAIRPTDPGREPAMLASKLERDALRLYELIWKRMLACQMAPAVLDKTGVDLAVDRYTFRATGQVVKFPGYFAVYTEGHDEGEKVDSDDENLLPEIRESETVDLQDILPEQHFTKPPARYTEASLVKKLEAEGIGRPSTYAPTISTIEARGYVEKDGRALVPTDTGEVVTDFLVKFFAGIVDYQFTAKMEENFDDIADGDKKWQAVLTDFYGPFHQLIESGENIDRGEATQARLLGTHPDTGKPIYAKLGRYGAMLQMGETESEEKPAFAPLLTGQTMANVTMEQALTNFTLPREVGLAEDGTKVVTQIGRFGPYIRNNKTFVSITEEELFSITLADALARVAEKKEAAAKALVHDWEAEGIQVKIGRWGPYVTDGKKNVKLAKDADPKALTLAEAQKMIAEAPEKKGRWGARKTAAKKAPAKKKAVAKKK